MLTSLARPRKATRSRAPPLHCRSESGKVFVEYETKESAQKAALSLAGRQFAQRIVKVEYANEDKFARREFE